MILLFVIFVCRLMYFLFFVFSCAVYKEVLISVLSLCVFTVLPFIKESAGIIHINRNRPWLGK